MSSLVHSLCKIMFSCETTDVCHFVKLCSCVKLWMCVPKIAIYMRPLFKINWLDSLFFTMSHPKYWNASGREQSFGWSCIGVVSIVLCFGSCSEYLNSSTCMQLVEILPLLLIFYICWSYAHFMLELGFNTLNNLLNLQILQHRDDTNLSESVCVGWQVRTVLARDGLVYFVKKGAKF
jgi:hypothetical protein